MQEQIVPKKQSRPSLVAQLMQTMMVMGRLGQANDRGKLLQKYGFSVPQMPMLFHISMSEKGVSIKDIAARLNITSSAATQLVQTLLRRGMLQKFKSPSDGRAVCISFTQSGKKEFAALQKGMLAQMQQSFSPVPDAELQEMIKLFQKIISYMKPLIPTKE
jgi:DNA-binding MarR family transcriptional regulator